MKRPPLIFIAGWGHSAQALHRVASEFDESYDVRVSSSHEIASQSDTTHQNRSKAVKKTSHISSYAEGLKYALCGPERKDNPSIVVGWSAGGIVALEVACENPELIEGLVLIGATPKFCTGDGYPWGIDARNVRAMVFQIRKDPKAVLYRFFQDVSWPVVESEETLNKKVTAANHIGIEHLVHGLEYLHTMDLRDKLKAIKIPTLIIHGREDRIVPWQSGAWLNNSLQNSSITIYEGVGHDIPERRPVVLASEMREFLENRF